MQILQSVLCLLRRPGVATSPVPMPHLSSTSRPLVSFMASAPPHSALARRVSPLTVAPNQELHRISGCVFLIKRFSHGSRSMASTSGVKGYKSGKSGRRSLISSSTNNHSAISQGLKKVEARGKTLEVRRSATKERKKAVVLSDEEYVNTLEIFPTSTHRESVMVLYKTWALIYGKETISLLTVVRGSLIKMAGPKRGIDLFSCILIEYDTRIKTGEQEDNDLQLIDGISPIGDLGGLWNCAFKTRIPGDHGEIDLTMSRVHRAVEATVEIAISQVQSGFNLCLRCFIGGFDEEIQLFDGAIGEPCGLKRSVIALGKGSTMDLKFRVGVESSRSAEHGCSFEADTHGRATREIRTGFGLISAKVTWSTLVHG